MYGVVVGLYVLYSSVCQPAWLCPPTAAVSLLFCSLLTVSLSPPSTEAPVNFAVANWPTPSTPADTYLCRQGWEVGPVAQRLNSN